MDDQLQALLIIFAGMGSMFLLPISLLFSERRKKNE